MPADAKMPGELERGCPEDAKMQGEDEKGASDKDEMGFQMSMPRLAMQNWKVKIQREFQMFMPRRMRQR